MLADYTTTQQASDRSKHVSFLSELNSERKVTDSLVLNQNHTSIYRKQWFFSDWQKMYLLSLFSWLHKHRSRSSADGRILPCNLSSHNISNSLYFQALLTEARIQRTVKLVL